MEQFKEQGYMFNMTGHESDLCNNILNLTNFCICQGQRKGFFKK